MIKLVSQTSLAEKVSGSAIIAKVTAPYAKPSQPNEIDDGPKQKAARGILRGPKRSPPVMHRLLNHSITRRDRQSWHERVESTDGNKRFSHFTPENFQGAARVGNSVA